MSNYEFSIRTLLTVMLFVFVGLVSFGFFFKNEAEQFQYFSIELHPATDDASKFRYVDHDEEEVRFEFDVSESATLDIRFYCNVLKDGETVCDITLCPIINVQVKADGTAKVAAFDRKHLTGMPDFDFVLDSWVSLENELVMQCELVGKNGRKLDHRLVVVSFNCILE
jgi:hypothetical protein